MGKAVSVKKSCNCSISIMDRTIDSLVKFILISIKENFFLSYDIVFILCFLLYSKIKKVFHKKERGRMKPFKGSFRQKVRDYWSNLMHSVKEHKMSRGAAEVMKMITR